MTNTHTHTRLTTLCPELPRWAGTTRYNQSGFYWSKEIVSGNGISWAVCKSASRSRQTTMPAPHNSVFYRPNALPAAQKRCLTVQQRCTWGVSLTILNIRLIRLVPSNAGLSAHISYRRQPSAYRYNSPQETCSKISKAVHKELILNTGIYFSWYYKWLAQSGKVFIYITFDMVCVCNIASNAATAAINTTTT